MYALQQKDIVQQTNFIIEFETLVWSLPQWHYIMWQTGSPLQTIFLVHIHIQTTFTKQNKNKTDGMTSQINSD